MNSESFLEALRGQEGATVSLAMVDEMLRRYPFFTLPATMLIEREGAALDPAVRSRLMAHIALNAGDTSTMMAMLDPDGQRWLNFYPEEHPVETTTTDAIDTFLENYGSTSDRETALLERLIFNPVPDYAEVLAAEGKAEAAEAAADAQTQAIDAFLSAHGAASEPRAAAASKPKPSAPKETRKRPAQMPDTPPASGLLSESLAQIYIKQKKYAKAYDILQAIAREHPQRSPFIADQLRFLSKVIRATAGHT